MRIWKQRKKRVPALPFIGSPNLDACLKALFLIAEARRALKVIHSLLTLLPDDVQRIPKRSEMTPFFHSRTAAPGRH